MVLYYPGPNLFSGILDFLVGFFLPKPLLISGPIVRFLQRAYVGL